MGKITTLDELREEIRNLEHQNYVNEQHMRRRVGEIAERFKPSNILKNLWGHFFGGPSDVKTSLFKMAAGIATSVIVKKFFRKGKTLN
jgi:hypothetical protein